MIRPVPSLLRLYPCPCFKFPNPSRLSKVVCHVLLIIILVTLSHRVLFNINYRCQSCPRYSFTTADYYSEFKQVETLNSSLYVYSALRDSVGIRIVSLKLRNQRLEPLVCAVIDSFSGTIAGIMTASVKEISEHHYRLYTAASILCEGRNFRKTPYHDSSAAQTSSWLHARWVGLMKESKILTVLPVEGNIPYSGAMSNDLRDSKVQFTVCVPPLHANFSAENQLVEKLEMSRLLGVGRVILYNYSISPRVNSILNWYVTEGRRNEGSSNFSRLLVEIRRWNLPDFMANETILHYYGQLAAIDDCLNRNRWLTDYIEFSDLDEFPLPLRHYNWSQFIAHSRRLINVTPAGFIFRNSFFATKKPSPAQGFEAVAQKYKSSVLSYTIRENFLWKMGDRSKMIVNPLYIKEMGIHLPKERKRHYPILSVPLTFGFLHHYRYENDTDNLIQDKRAASRYGRRLTERLRTIWSSIDKHVL